MRLQVRRGVPKITLPMIMDVINTQVRDVICITMPLLPPLHCAVDCASLRHWHCDEARMPCLFIPDARMSARA